MNMIERLSITPEQLPATGHCNGVSVTWSRPDQKTSVPLPVACCYVSLFTPIFSSLSDKGGGFRNTKSILSHLVEVYLATELTSVC